MQISSIHYPIGHLNLIPCNSLVSMVRSTLRITRLRQILLSDCRTTFQDGQLAQAIENTNLRNK